MNSPLYYDTNPVSHYNTLQLGRTQDDTRNFQRSTQGSPLWIECHLNWSVHVLCTKDSPLFAGELFCNLESGWAAINIGGTKFRYPPPLHNSTPHNFTTAHSTISQLHHRQWPNYWTIGHLTIVYICTPHRLHNCKPHRLQNCTPHRHTIAPSPLYNCTLQHCTSVPSPFHD